MRCGVTALALLAAHACSPEAQRVRDGGAGADPGNKNVVVREFPDPGPADTTLRPGRAATPVERLERGVVPPPTYPGKSPVPGRGIPVTPGVSPTEPQQRTFDRDGGAEAR